MVVLHGLRDGRVLIVKRAQPAMVDGIAHRDIMTTLFDDSPEGTLGVAVVSYNGDVYFGLGADPGVVDDVEEFASHLKAAADACTELARAVAP
jgi:WS/DGAT C-terminal domain